MSIFPTHDISQNQYYHSFYSYNPADDPTVIKSFLYDNNQSLVDSTDISFGSGNPYDVLAFLENSGTKPYAIGKVGSDFRSMDITFGSVFKKSLKESQRQVLMTYLNSTYKNVHGTANQTLAVTVSNASGSNKYYLDGSTSPGQTVFALTEGYYVFDQSDSTNVTHPLVIGETDGAGTSYSSMITEGTIGSLNGYTIVDISAGTPDLFYYCSAHSGMGGQILNFISATVTSYTVTVVNSATHGQNIYAIDGSTDYYDAGSLVFNAGTKITFTDRETYIFDQSDESNAGYPIVFGVTKDDTSNLYTTGVTVVGTPGQPGAYTRIDYTGTTALFYFSSGAINMGYGPTTITTPYTVIDPPLSKRGNSDSYSTDFDDSRLASANSWATSISYNYGEWMYIGNETDGDIGIVGVKIMPRANGGQHIIKFTAEYSSDNINYYPIDGGSEFSTNFSTASPYNNNQESLNYFDTPVLAQYIRITPTDVYMWISMRAGLIQGTIA